MVDIDSAIFDGNNSPGDLFSVDGSFLLRYSTITDNTTPTIFSVYSRPGGDPVQVDVSGSAIWNPGASIVTFYGGGPASVVRNGCLLAHSTAGISNPAAVRTGNPQFAADFTPGIASPALDVCNAFFDATAQDVYGTARPIDQSGVPNALGPHDLGAVERPMDPPDTIFANGFE
jgi:hypothetical protein